MNKKLKIGLFIDTYFPMIDGVIMVVDNYARRLSSFCDVVVFAPEGRKPFDDTTLPYKVIRCKKKFPLKFLDYDLPLPKQDREFMNALKNENLDLVHIHSPFSIGKVGVQYAKQHGIPVVATMHSQFELDFKKATKSKLITHTLLKSVMKVFNSCDECWAVNAAIAKIFSDYGATTFPKVQNNGTDMLYFENDDEIRELRKKYEIAEDQKVLLFTGRLVALKNIFFIEKALKSLKEKGFKFKMFFIGTGTDEKKLKKNIEADNLEKNIIFTGKIADRIELSKYYRMADLFLFPSVYDASSLVQIEAATQKTPTLFLRDSATSATVTEDVNGFIADYSVDSFAQKIIDIFEDEQKYRQVCENAYRDLNISWDDAVEKVYSDYLVLLENKKQQPQKNINE